MGRKLNVSTPTVINTELVPLSESFYIEADGNLEQWYYENDDRYAPNRKVTPMTLTPCISAFDADTQQTYTPSFYTVRWFEQAWDSTQGAYVETEITNTVDSLSADYVKVGDTLLVKKNVGYTHSVTITCKAQYIDPRDSGITYNISDTVLLTTNRDATVVTPELYVDCPSSQAFNPLVDNEIVNGNLQYKSEFTMKASSDYSSVLATNVAQYKVYPLGTEEIIPTNETALMTSAPTMDIRYGDYEQTGQTFMRRQTSGGQIPYIAGNMAYVNKIKGNTVRWSQLVKNGNFANKSMWTEEAGVTFTVSNGVAHITKSTSANNGIRQNITYIASHRVFMSCQAYCATATTVKLTFSGGIEATKTLEAGKWTTVSAINYGNEGRAAFYILEQSSEGHEILVKDVNVLDLTDLGIANLTTVAEVEAWLAANIGLKSYYPYNEGELIPVKMSAIKSVGFNLWDEQWEQGSLSTASGEPIGGQGFRSKNFIPVIGCKSYCIYYGSRTPQTVIYYYIYDNAKNLLATQYTSSVWVILTMPSNAAYIKVRTGGNNVQTTYNHDICINLSDSSRNGTYEAHWEAEQYLPITELKGKVNGTGDSVVIFPNGMKLLSNTLYDEIKVEDGVIKAIKRVGKVNLEDCSWMFDDSNKQMYTFSITDVPSTGFDNVKLICNRLPISSQKWSSYPERHLRGFNTRVLYISTNEQLSSSELENYEVYYELATPVEYIIDNMPRGQFEWYGISNNAEVLVENLPWYKSGQHTDTLVVDAMYGEEIRVVLRSRVSAGSDRLYPNKVYRSIVWQIPNVDTNTVSKNGGAVRSNTVEMEFDTIINVKGSVLSEQLKQDNLRFNWKIRKSNVSTETDKGWGQQKVIPASDLRNIIGSSSSLASTFVLPYVYLLGANEAVVDNNEEVTDNGEIVYDRPVF